METIETFSNINLNCLVISLMFPFFILEQIPGINFQDMLFGYPKLRSL